MNIFTDISSNLENINFQDISNNSNTYPYNINPFSIRNILLGNLLLSNQHNPSILTNPLFMNRLTNQNNISTTNNFINNTLNVENKYKTVIADEEKEKLNKTTFTENICTNDTCPITQEKFQYNDEIIILPCQHGFKDDILLWLEKESNECPICRYTFKGKEIVNNNYTENNDTTPINTSRQNFLQSYQRSIFPFSRNIFTLLENQINEDTYDDDFQQAIINSLN
jgi:hypothetical protein